MGNSWCLVSIGVSLGWAVAETPHSTPSVFPLMNSGGTACRNQLTKARKVSHPQREQTFASLIYPNSHGLLKLCFMLPRPTPRKTPLCPSTPRPPMSLEEPKGYLQPQ